MHECDTTQFSGIDKNQQKTELGQDGSTWKLLWEFDLRPESPRVALFSFYLESQFRQL